MPYFPYQALLDSHNYRCYRSLNTYKRNGGRNIADPSKGGAVDLKDSILDDYRDGLVNIRKAGFIRIPVCDPEEARANIAIGLSEYSKINNP